MNKLLLFGGLLANPHGHGGGGQSASHSGGNSGKGPASGANRRAALFVALIAAAAAIAFLGLQVLRISPLLLAAGLLLVARMKGI